MSTLGKYLYKGATLAISFPELFKLLVLCYTGKDTSSCSDAGWKTCESIRNNEWGRNQSDEGKDVIQATIRCVTSSAEGDGSKAVKGGAVLQGIPLVTTCLVNTVTPLLGVVTSVVESQC